MMTISWVTDDNYNRGYDDDDDDNDDDNDNSYDNKDDDNDDNYVDNRDEDNDDNDNDHDDVCMHIPNDPKLISKAVATTIYWWSIKSVSEPATTWPE